LTQASNYLDIVTNYK